MSRIAAAARILVAGAGASLLLGCLHSNVDLHWGEAQRANVAAQIADPDAGKVAGPGPQGLDPGTAEAVAETYYENQKPERGGGPFMIDVSR